MMARNKNITAVSQHKRRIQLLVGQLALRHRHLQVARVPLPLRVLLPLLAHPLPQVLPPLQVLPPPQVLLLHLDRLLPHTQVTLTRLLAIPTPRILTLEILTLPTLTLEIPTLPRILLTHTPAIPTPRILTLEH